MFDYAWPYVWLCLIMFDYMFDYVWLYVWLCLTDMICLCISWPAWKCWQAPGQSWSFSEPSQIYFSYVQHPAVLEAGSMKDSSTTFSAFERSCITGYRAVAVHRLQMSSACWNFGTEQDLNKCHESNNSPEPNDYKNGSLIKGPVISPVLHRQRHSSMVIIHWFTTRRSSFPNQMEPVSPIFFCTALCGFWIGYTQQPLPTRLFTKNTFNGWCTNGARDKGLAKVYTLNCNFNHNSVD